MRLPAFFLIILVCGCVCCGPPRPPDENATSLTQTTLVEEYSRESCEMAGGKWGKTGLSARESCNLPTSDGGKPCSDTDECEATCLAQLSDSERARAMHGEKVAAEGKCSGWKVIVGCQAFVNHGQATLICLD